MAPGQLFKAPKSSKSNGCILLVHPDFLLSYPLAKKIKQYGFSSYTTDEALHISEKEKETLFSVFKIIDEELKSRVDDFSHDVIVSQIDLLLNYSSRFYKRQFIDRSTNVSTGTVKRFQDVLKRYFETGQHLREGLPTVNHLAGDLFLSTRYLSDVLKQETGKNALEHIHLYLIAEAKNLLLSSNENVSGIAYQLGFESPSYFTRLFKKVVGLTPVQYKEQHMA